MNEIEELKELETQLYHVISGNYLCERIPVELIEGYGKDNEILEFVSNHLWQPLENMSPAEVLDMIQSNLQDVMTVIVHCPQIKWKSNA